MSTHPYEHRFTSSIICQPSDELHDVFLTAWRRVLRKEISFSEFDEMAKRRLAEVHGQAVQNAVLNEVLAT